MLVLKCINDKNVFDVIVTSPSQVVVSTIH